MNSSIQPRIKVSLRLTLWKSLKGMIEEIQREGETDGKIRRGSISPRNGKAIRYFQTIQRNAGNTS